MKKLGIALVFASLVICGCTATPKKKKRTSSIEELSSEIVESSEMISSTPEVISSQTISSKTTGSSASISSQNQQQSSQSSTGSSSQIQTVVHEQKIGTIKSERKINQRVSFTATYIREITLNNEKVLMFADETGYIGFRCTAYNDYINNTYRFHEYTVTGKLVEKTNNLEVAYDSDFGDLKASVVIRNDISQLSYDEYNTTLPIQLDGIEEFKEKSALLEQDNKHNAYGDLVKITLQYANYEDDNSKQKVLLVDDKGHGLVAIQDYEGTAGHKVQAFMNEDNIGKWYTVTGIISIKTSIPAILALTAVASSKESGFKVSLCPDLTESVAEAIFKGNLTQDKMNPLDMDYYFSLYHGVGYIIPSETSYDGFALTQITNLTPSSSSTNKAFQLVNGKKYDFSPWAGSPIDIWFKIESYDTQNHIWRIFLIQELLPTI